MAEHREHGPGGPWAKFFCHACDGVQYSLIPAIEVEPGELATLAVLCPQCGALHEQPVPDEAVIVLLDGGASVRWEPDQVN